MTLARPFPFPDPTCNRNPYLHAIDIVVVALVMFGCFIWSSTQALLAPEPIFHGYSETDDLYGFIQLAYLAVAALYLRVRGFSLARLPWGISFRSTVLGVGLFVLLAAGADAAMRFLGLLPLPVPTMSPEAVAGPAPASLTGHLLRVAYAVLNGIYEELFFLGIVTAVQRRWLPAAIVFSLVVRFSFHTYQGMHSALLMLLLGLAMLALFARTKRLWPLMVAHVFADVAGLSLGFLDGYAAQ